LRPQLEPPDIERFLASLGFMHKRKLEKSGIEIGTFG
jgi:hypothetical protein